MLVPPGSHCRQLQLLLLFFLAAGEGGCVGRLECLHLASLRLSQPVLSTTWRHLAPGLTALTWLNLTRLNDGEEFLHGHELFQASSWLPA